jgi:hypothetical protein
MYFICTLSYWTLHSVVTFIICGHYIRFNVVEILKLVLEMYIKYKEVVDFIIQHA